MTPPELNFFWLDDGPIDLVFILLEIIHEELLPEFRFMKDHYKLVAVTELIGDGLGDHIERVEVALGGEVEGIEEDIVPISEILY